MIRGFFRGWGRPEGSSLWKWRGFALAAAGLAVVGLVVGPRPLCLLSALLVIVGLGFSPFDPAPEEGDDD